MKKTIKFLLIGILLLVLAGCSKPVSSGPEIFGVYAISNGTEYEPVETVLHSGGRMDGQFFSASGHPFMIEQIFELLQEIQYGEDFQVVVFGDNAKSINYSLFNDSYDKVYENEEDFLLPDEAGVYILCADVHWIINQGDRRNEGYQMSRYAFKIKWY